MANDRKFSGALACALLVLLPCIAAAAPPQATFGTLSLRAQPRGADVLIDGERWTETEGGPSLVVQLSAGTHRIEIRSPGYDVFVREITIRAGETTTLNVALTRRDSENAPTDSRQTSAPPQPPRPAGKPGGFVQAMPSQEGPVIAPVFRVTEIDHETATLVGVYGGYVFAGRLLIGAGGYWQANTTHGARIIYGGPVVEWRTLASRTIGFNLHGLVGGGLRYAAYSPVWGDPYPYHYGPPAGSPYRNLYDWHDDVFFVAEPEAQVVVRFGRSARVLGGVGYRATSESNLSGVSGSISVQFGR